MAHHPSHQVALESAIAEAPSCAFASIDAENTDTKANTAIAAYGRRLIALHIGIPPRCWKARRPEAVRRFARRYGGNRDHGPGPFSTRVRERGLAPLFVPSPFSSLVLIDQLTLISQAADIGAAAATKPAAAAKSAAAESAPAKSAAQTLGGNSESS